MTERKWTPGPWVAESGSKSCHCCFEGSIYKKTGPKFYDYEYVAECFDERDMHLIAAAPDLYDALDASMIYLECCCDPDGSDPASKVLSAARAALAKARGEK